MAGGLGGAREEASDSGTVIRKRAKRHVCDILRISPRCLGEVLLTCVEVGGVPHDQNMLNGYLPKVIYYLVYQYTKKNRHMCDPFYLENFLEVSGSGLANL
jgi:hypothetical protein